MLLPPDGGLLLDIEEVFVLVLELVLPRARLPMTLNVTEKTSFLGLLKRRLRAAEVSFALSALSAPSFLL